jgi:thymidylate synthase (FAD)
MMRRMEAAGRTCYKSEDKITISSAGEFLQKIIKLGHLTILEHESMSVRIICDRGVTHEIVRHRIASYSQESTRYCNYGGEEMQFIIPNWCANIKPGIYREVIPLNGFDGSAEDWMQAMLNAEQSYNDLIKADWSPQQARSVLPNSLKTEIVMTANLREWKHFFNLRCAKAAHPQMREIAIPMLKAFYDKLPVVFEKEILQFT